MRQDLFPTIAGLMVGALLLGGLPILMGLAIAPDSKPAFTVDICHPLGVFAHCPDVAEAPLLPARFVEQTLRQFGIADPSVAPLRSRPAEAPLAPPPRSLQS